ncbi:hypothetical protein GOP47_0005498 [Adiantum capillus-veneris]|uniref:Uncharacterized protein n=1 Tax=Adiantum capillus-veneris TaxID=13818 RepID=A0A9D4ZLM6_ADICA|nr:hypothetical protein GOP47_0005498 [Adiantum capillus-veneris]
MGEGEGHRVKTDGQRNGVREGETQPSCWRGGAVRCTGVGQCAVGEGDGGQTSATDAGQTNVDDAGGVIATTERL